MIDKLIEDANIYLPRYLTPEKQQDLYKELKSFPIGFNYFLNNSDEDSFFQGDAWNGFTLIDFLSESKRNVKGIILSNTCDINPENGLPLNRNVIFSPLISLEKFKDVLDSSGKSSEQIEDIIENIKKQYATYIYFIPKINGVIDESIILLDNLYVQPMQTFINSTKNNLFRLSTGGHYLFLIKLSIHFTRLFEGVSREEHSATV